jgi:hypothetical protein
MPRVKIAADTREPVSVDSEVARLRDLAVDELRVSWEAAHNKKAPPHLPRHLLFRILAYRIQVARLGDLDVESQRILDRSGSLEQASKRAGDVNRRTNSLRPGTMLSREWNGRMHRVAVLVDGFSWNGNTYPSLSKVAFAITGTRWNGPRFFGLRDSQRSTRERS